MLVFDKLLDVLCLRFDVIDLVLDDPLLLPMLNSESRDAISHCSRDVWEERDVI